MPTNSSSFKQILGAVVIGAVIAGAFYGGIISGRAQEVRAQRFDSIVNKEVGKPENVDFGLFWKAWSVIEENYVATGKSTSTIATDQDKVYGAIQGLTASLGDPYTVFFPPAENEAFLTEIEGNFEGIGMEMGIKDNVLTVISPLPNSPAKRAGILSGDKVIKINDTIATSMTVEQAVKLIRGKKGTEVILTIVREGVTDPFELKIVRDVINLPVIETKSEGQIFTIKMYSFSTQSANLFRSALREFVLSGSNKLVLDLRGNPGGVLDAAVDMASWFLPPGKVVVREDYGSGKPETVEKSRGYDIFNDNLKMVILIDGGSASASEILAGALSEHGKATLVGTKTFGKGSVQQLVNIDDKTALKITIAKWLTPNGVSITGNGIEPSVEVKLTQEDIKNNNDLQMKKAVEILSQ
jgi:carboxyl-terminal processing protease